MEPKTALFIFLMVIVGHIGLAQRISNGYFYEQPKTQISSHQELMQHLQPPPQQQSNIFGISQPGQEGSNTFANFQIDLPFIPNPTNIAFQQQAHQPHIPNIFNPPHITPQDQAILSQELMPPPQQINLPTIPNSAAYNFPFKQQSVVEPALDFQLPHAPQLNDINFSPPHPFNPQSQNSLRIPFEVMNEFQGNSIEACNHEPIVGQFKPELVDLANGGPLTRMITTCGRDGIDCKTIVLRSDLNRVQGVLRELANNPNRLQYFQQNRPEQIRDRQIPGSNADIINELVLRPKSRRLFPDRLPLDFDIYN